MARVPTTRPTFVVVVAVVAAVLLRVVHLDAEPYWIDEAGSVWVANQSLPAAWQYLSSIDVHPPLYYVLLHGWQSLWGDGERATRLLSVLLGVATIPVFFVALRRVLDAPAALLATLLLAASPFHVRYAQETRMYTLLTFEMACALYLGARLLTERESRVRPAPWIGLGVIEAAMMWTHNAAAVFAILSLNAAALAVWWPTRRRHEAVPWMLTQGGALLLWLPWAPSFVAQATRVDRDYWLPFPDLATVTALFSEFSFGTIPVAAWLRVAATVAVLGVTLLGARAVRSATLRQAFLLLLFVPVASELLVSLRRPLFYERTLIYASLPFYALVASGIVAGWRASSASNLRRGAVVGVLALSGGLSVLGLVGYYRFAHKEAWNRVAEYVAARRQPGDLVLLSGSWAQIPFEYYLRRTGAAVDMRGLPVNLFDRGVQEPKMTADDLPRLRELVRDRTHVWLVYTHASYTDARHLVPAELQRLMVPVDSVSFTGVQLVEFTARAASPDSR